MINAKQSLTGDLNCDIIKQYPELEDLTVTPSKEQQVFHHENSYGYDTVTVNPIEGDELVVTPTKEQQNFSGVFDNVSVNAVTSTIDENIIAENIKSDVEILGVRGNFVGGKYCPRSICFYQFPYTTAEAEINGMDIINMTSVTRMFYYSRIQEVDLTGWNYSNLKNLDNMFQNASNMQIVKLGNETTSNIKTLNSTFYGLTNLKRCDLSNAIFGTTVTLEGTWYNCSLLEYLDIRTMSADKTTIKGTATFYNVPDACEIIVKDDAMRQLILNHSSRFTNIKTVAELTE